MKPRSSCALGWSAWPATRSSVSASRKLPWSYAAIASPSAPSERAAFSAKASRAGTEMGVVVISSLSGEQSRGPRAPHPRRAAQPVCAERTGRPAPPLPVRRQILQDGDLLRFDGDVAARGEVLEDATHH